MSDHDAIRQDLRTAFAGGRLAHAYVVIGDPDGAAGRVAEWLLQLVFCEAPEADARPCGACRGCRKVADRSHEDVHTVEPQSKSRRISVKDHIRPLNHALHMKTFGTGWKAGVVRHADRMGTEAANAFLKTLEEPPPRTLILLLTSAPQALLNTILSRCQVLSLSSTGIPESTAEWRGPLRTLLAEGWPRSPFQATALASRIEALLAAVSKKQTEALKGTGEDLPKDVLEARVRSAVLEQRSAMLKDILNWHRDVLLSAAGGDPEAFAHPEAADTIREQAERIDLDEALRRVRRLEHLPRRLDLNLPLAAVLAEAFKPDLRRKARAKT